MKGQKTGGRQVGTPNKLTSDVKAFMTNVLDEYYHTQFIDDLNTLDPVKRLQIIAQLSRIFIPPVTCPEVSKEVVVTIRRKPDNLPPK